MKVIIKGIPGKSAIPQNRINPFSVPDEFKYGGAKQGMGTQNNTPIRSIDVYSDYLRQPDGQNGYQQSPYKSTGKQLPDVPKEDNPDIVVEKKEQVMGDFNGDGMPVLMGVNAGSHESGNDQGINVPDGSFVFSDTPSLKIKDPQLLDMFGMKKAATPALIAKKYDLTAYKKILDDPQRGEVDKNTAKLMYTNFTNKLNTLASVQEDMKKKQDAMKAAASQARNAMPQYKKGGKYMEVGGDPDGGGYNSSQSAFGHGNRPAYKESGKKKGTSKSSQGTTLVYNPEWSWDGIMPVQPNQYPANDIPNYLPARKYIAPLGNSSAPDTQYPVAGPMTPPTLPDIKGAGRQGQIPSMPPNLSPDALAAITAGLRYGQYPDYNPVRQVAHGAYAQPVFADPTRAKAAVQEAATSAGNTIAMGATGPIARANILALQGKAGTQAADIESQYATKNAEIANRTNEQAAGLYNQLWKDQQGYNKDYAEETHNAQMDKLGYQFGVQNELLKQAYQAENRQRTAQNYNYINPYYTMDSHGYIYPKSDAQMKALQSITNGNPSGGSGSSAELDRYKTLYDMAIAKGASPERADKWAAGESGMMKRYSDIYDPNNPMKQKEHSSGDYSRDNKRGGPINKGTTKMKILAIPSK